jgi:hypothetical protein
MTYMRNCRQVVAYSREMIIAGTMMTRRLLDEPVVYYCGAAA